jgi:hypothetical protein
MRGLLSLAFIASIFAACSDDPSPACSATKGTLCDGSVLQTCVDGNITKRDCNAEQLACGFVDSSKGSTCVADPCAAIGPLGICDGDDLIKCTAGNVVRSSCANGQSCGFLDAQMGYGCVADASLVTFVGTVRYEDKPPLGNGKLGAIQQLPARGVTVAIVDDTTKQTLATAMTSDSGAFVIRFAATTTMVHVTGVAQSKSLIRPVSVVLPNNTVHGFGSPSAPGNADAQLEVLITDASNTSEAFNIFDQALKTMDSIVRDLGDPTPTALKLVWSRGHANGTFYGGNSIFLLGTTDDDDGYDDTVILHETGHFVEDSEGRSDSPGGPHGGAPVTPTLAWSEGFSTYWACATQNQPIYSDSNANGGFADNIDTDNTAANAAAGVDQNVSENLISEILWDLGDNRSKAGADDDMVSDGTHNRVVAVQPKYLATASLRNVGAQGVDLVDFLDGWFKLNGLSSCPGSRAIVAKHTFPYDFAGPGGTCP